MPNYLSRNSYNQYLLVRNPYDRVVSCFSDKFRRSPLRREEEEGWQSSQILAFSFIGLKGNEDFEEIRSRLLSFEFRDFIKMLPQVYRKECHYFPQYFMNHPRIKKHIAGPRIRFKKVYKIESDLHVAAEDIDLDFAVRTQKSEHGPSEEYFDDETLGIINSIYQCDFQFGYDMIE